MKIKKTFTVFASVLLLALTGISCSHEVPDSNIGMAMIDIDFNNKIVNKGMSDVNIEAISPDFEKGLTDSCLNLSGTSNKRNPVVVMCNEDVDITDYRQFTVEIWIKKVLNDNNRYVIAGSKKTTNKKTTGWEIASTCNGSWSWRLSDGETVWSYTPTNLLQKLNDQQWHQIAFSVNVQQKEARLYFDGKNKAVFSLHGIKNSILNSEYVIGSDPFAVDMQKEAFNGFIDNFKIWARALGDDDIKQSYISHQGVQIIEDHKSGNKLSVMTWNITRGGTIYGKKVGVDRVTDVIKGIDPDIVILQETERSGEIIADALGYYFFRRSNSLTVLSRYPFGKSYDIYSPDTFGCITVITENGKEIFVCPVMLDSKPNTNAYVMTGQAIPDTIINREMETRGLQMRFILGELASFSLNKQNTLIIAGDFNSGSHLDWTEKTRKEHYGIVVDYPVSTMLEEEKFTDTYRAVNPDETEHPGITWSPVFKNTLQDRIDFIYYKGEALTPEKSFVTNTYTYDFPSTHAAVVTVFSLN
jgi:endonuclease/exonuclease/phosphatase family metal-dependent hydrolase